MTLKRSETRKKAIALGYDPEQPGAPRVLAKGQGLLAERIIEIAGEHGIHVHEDPGMVGVLARLDVNAEIPEDLYRAVAEVLAFVYRLNKRFKDAT